MISTSVTAAFITALILTLLFPIVLLIVLGVKRKITAMPLLMGFGTFFIAQIVLRIPLLNFLAAQSWWQDIATHTVFYIFLLSLSAGLFEEGARLGGARILKNRRTWKDAMSFGLGHGLCEVILLIGLTHLNNVLLSLLLGAGGPDALAALIPAAQIEQITTQLSAVTPLEIYLGIVERLSAVLFHIFAAVLIFRGIIQKKTLRYFLLAIAAHTAFNFAGVWLAQNFALWIAEFFMLLFALAGMWYVLAVRKKWAPAFGSL